MKQAFAVVILVLIWVISFIEPSGWSMMMHLPDKVNTIIYLSALLLFMLRYKSHERMNELLGIIMGIVFVYVPFALSGKWEAANYVTSFLVVYITSNLMISRAVIKYSAIAIGILGLIVMNIYVNGDILSGWNDNNISMVGLFSFIYFSIYLITIRTKKAFWFWNIITAFYISLLFQTSCRSGMLFAITMVVCLFFTNKTRRFFSKSTVQILLLNFPLILAFIVIWIGDTSYMSDFNKFSQDSYEKMAFSGRDQLWDLSLKYLAKSDYMGSGKFLINYHNSAIACLSVFGVMGYIVWIKYFQTVIKSMRPYLKFDLVYGSMLAFFMIFLQQSVDLGFISSQPNYLPYAILGVGIGYTKHIDRLKQLNGQRNNPRL